MTNPITEPTQSIRERLAQASWKSDGVTLPYPWHAISWEDAPKNEKQPHFDSVDAILSELMEPSEGLDAAVTEQINDEGAVGPWMEQSEIQAIRRAMIQHIRDGGK